MSKTDSYEIISGLVGEAMNTAWVKFMTDLSQLKVPKEIEGLKGGQNIATNQIQDFLELCGGAYMGIDFSCVEPKGEVRKCYANPIDFNVKNAADSKAVSGSISLGVNIGF